MATQLSVVLLLLCVVVVPIALVAFARSGKGYSEIGKGRFAVDFEESNEVEHQEEVRQLVEAKAYRQARRGGPPVDVEKEVQRLLEGHLPGEEEDGAAPTTERAPAPAAPLDPETAAIREEIRQVVIAGNERRERRGEAPLDVETEIDRMMAEFGPG